MSQATTGHNRLPMRKVLLRVAVASAIAFVVLLIANASVYLVAPCCDPVPSPADSPLVVISLMVGLVGTCLTSFTTFVGFLVTTTITIIRDRREGQAASLARRSQEIDIQKKQHELEAQKAQPTVKEDKPLQAPPEKIDWGE